MIANTCTHPIRVPSGKENPVRLEDMFDLVPCGAQLDRCAYGYVCEVGHRVAGDPYNRR